MMGAVWMHAAQDLRRRWRGAVVLGVLLAVVGGVVMTAAASARRTTTAYERLLAGSKAYDVEVQITGDADPAVLDRVATLPEVAEHGRIAFIPSSKATPSGTQKSFSWDLTTVALVDANIARTMEIPTMRSGRFPRATDPHEAFVNERFAEVHHLEPGDSFTIQLATFPEIFELFGGGHPVATGPVVRLTIAGIGRIPHDVSISEPRGILALTPAFFETYSARIAHLWGMFVRLHGGDAEVPAFLDGAKAIARAAAGGQNTEEEVLSFRSNIQSRGGVDRALGVQSFALWIFVAVVGSAALLVLGQALGRWQTIAADDQGVLRSLGMGRSELALTSALPVCIVALGSGALAVAISIALSPLVPIGFARAVEPDLGVFADVVILGIGAAAIVVLVSGWAWLRAAVLARRARGGTADERARPSAAADLAARNGLPAPVVTGVRFGLEPGRGRSAVPVRSVLAGTTLALVAVVGAFVFSRSLEHMLATPANYGWNFDLVAFGGDDPEFVAELERKLVASPLVAELSRISIRTTTFKRRDLETLGVEHLKGDVAPVVLDGRFPRTPNEVALASRTMREAGVGIGDTLTLPAPAGSCPNGPCDARFRVVGKIIHWGEGSDSDDGAGFTAAGQARVRLSQGFLDFLVRIPPGRDRLATMRAIEREFGDTVSPFAAEAQEFQEPILGSNLRNVERVRGMPTVLSSVLGALALVTLIHALLMTSRRRRYDLAVLKTLGFVRRQVMSTLAWQATTLVVLALLVGVPLGVVAGRWAWSALASRLGVVDATTVAPLWLLAGAAGTIVAANAIALLPGRSAAKTQPALVLRTE
jgi:hypothetical protein